MSNLEKPTGAERKQMRSRMKSLLAFLPNLLKLLYRMMRDPRVSRADKLILAGAIVYVITPFDFIPDFIPFIGQVDDIYLVAIVLLRFINRASEDVVTEHWDGSVDIKSLIVTISNLAQFFLPKRLRNILTGNLEKSAEVTDFATYTKKRSEQQ